MALLLRESVRPEPERRAAAPKGLGRTGRGEHTGVLVDAADAPAPRVRAAAALARAGSALRRRAGTCCPC
ncbi:hypothetical protein ACPCBX_26110 [Streptomyces tuirus]|uniref:Uncharacterized protein n=1 Tax=Streptomyces tuirus TaxID=68278 RepID=A0A7G1NNY4_9ACTN|nr:hypothetical protein [Streptomyces tuirus]BCL24928.1 hypothetical protein GCM10017668_67710 [Streptomyces tuirus]